MKFSEDPEWRGNIIRAYSVSEIVINGRTYHSSVLVTPDQVDDSWQPTHADELTESDFEAVLPLKPQLVILGTGARQIFPPASVYLPLIKAGIGIEIMDTQAACRTYNIVSSEGRSVVAALIL